MVELAQERLVVIDFETCNALGQGLLMYHDNFDILSMSAYYPYSNRCVFLQELPTIVQFLNGLLDRGYTFICYNASFEVGCLLRLGLDIADRIIDAMWLFKNIGMKGTSASLVSAVEEVLKIPNFKERHLQKLVDSGKVKTLKEAKSMVGSLEGDALEAYNNDDVIYTYKVYEAMVEQAAEIGYAWRTPQTLYMGAVRRNVRSYLKGIRYNRKQGKANLAKLIKERDDFIDEFFNEYYDAIECTLNILHTRAQEKRKNPTPYEWGRDIEALKNDFNIQSGKQLGVFLTEALNIYPPKRTDSGAPSTMKSYLPLYGEAGEKLAEIANFKKPIQEIEALLEHSKDTGRIHNLIRAGGTVTNRGASGLEHE